MPKDKYFIDKKNSGFTLIELSIVLVIIGLVAGGILLGSAMIKSAEQRKLVSKLEAYNTAVNTFRLKYECLPGDCKNASEFFDTANDGNGDKLLQPDPVESELLYSASWQRTYGFEFAYFWEHLSNAQLIDGAYDSSAIKGIGFPTTNDNHGVIVALNDFYAAEWDKPIAPYFFVGTQGDLSGLNINDSLDYVYTEEEALSIDSKFDDGKPNSGSIIGYTFRHMDADPIDLEYEGFPEAYIPVSNPGVLSGGMVNLNFPINGFE